MELAAVVILAVGSLLSLGLLVFQQDRFDRERVSWREERLELTAAALSAHGVQYIKPKPKAEELPDPKKYQPNDYIYDPDGQEPPILRPGVD